MQCDENRDNIKRSNHSTLRCVSDKCLCVIRTDREKQDRREVECVKRGLQLLWIDDAQG